MFLQESCEEVEINLEIYESRKQNRCRWAMGRKINEDDQTDGSALLRVRGLSIFVDEPKAIEFLKTS